MPFVSRLKKLGTLPVAELSTTLTAHLINLEDSEETNIVYTSSTPILPDATPPASIHFESPEIQSKSGDVLIWASRVRKKACFVHACWVFNGKQWVKQVSSSDIQMDHPVHPDYRLVIVSGPYVKWELKPDLNPNASLITPDSTPLRANGRSRTGSTTRSVVDGKSAADGNNGLRSPSTQNFIARSITPDGSAGFRSVSNSPSSYISQFPETETSSVTRGNEATATNVQSSLSRRETRAKTRETRHSSSSHQSTPTTVAPSVPFLSLRPPSVKSDFGQLKRRKLPLSVSSMPAAKKRKLDVPEQDGTTSLSSVSTATNTGVSFPRQQPSATPNKSSPTTKNLAPEKQGSSASTKSSPPGHPGSSQLPPPDPLSSSAPLKLETQDPRPFTSPVDYLRQANSPLAAEYQAKLEQLMKERDESRHSLNTYQAQAEADLEAARKRFEDMTIAHGAALAKIQELQGSRPGVDEELSHEVKSLKEERDSLMEALESRTRAEAEKTRRLEETLKTMENHVRRASNFESSLRGAQEAIQLQRTAAQESEARQRGIISQLSKELQANEQRTTKLTADLDTMEKRVKELESEVEATEAKALEEKLISQRITAEMVQLKRSNHEGHFAHLRLREALVVSQQNTAGAVAETEALRSQISEMQTEMETLKRTHSEEGESADQRIKELEKSIVFIEESRKKTQAQLTSQQDLKTQLDDLVAISDRERKRLEEILAERVGALQHDVDTKSRELHMLTSLSNALKERSSSFERRLASTESERKRLADLVSGKIPKLQHELTEKAVELKDAASKYQSLTTGFQLEKQRLLAEIERYTAQITQSRTHEENLRQTLVVTIKDLQASRADYLKLQTMMASNAEQMQKEFAIQRAKSTEENSLLRQELVESTRKCGELDKQLLSLSTVFAEHSRNLTARQAETAQAKAYLQAESQRFALELAQATKRFDEQLLEARTKMELARSSQCVLEQSIKDERANFEKQISEASEAVGKANTEASNQAALFQAEKNRMASELNSLRDGIGLLQEQLTKIMDERDQKEAELVRELTSVKRDSEQLSAELSASNDNLSSLKKQVGELDNQRLLAQTALQEQTAAFELERQVVSEEKKAHETELASLHSTVKKLTDRVSEAEGKLLSVTLDYNSQTSLLILAISSLKVERKRITVLTANRDSLKKQLEDEQSQKSMAEENLRILEVEYAEKLERTEATLSSELEVSRAEASRLNSELVSEREKFTVEREKLIAERDALKQNVVVTLGPEEELKILELALEKERANNRILRMELANQKNSSQVAGLSSELLRSLHEVQDQLKTERAVRAALQEQVSKKAEGVNGLKDNTETLTFS